MSKVFIEDTSLTAIGDAIRKKGKTEELLYPSEMPKAIEDLETGFGKPTLIYQITTNDGTLLGSTLTVNANGTLLQTFDLPDLTGTSINVETQPDTTYTAVLSDKEGFKKSELSSYTTNPNTPIYIVEGSYTLDRAFINVNVSSADGTVPTGVTITATQTGTQNKVTATFEGTNPVKLAVKSHTQYDVTVTDWVGGTTPAKATITTGDVNSETEVKMEYTQMPVVGKKFNDYTPAELKKISEKEAWADYNFKVGDRHAVAINGTVNGVNLTGTWYCQIIGFNHNWQKEGKGIALQFVNNSLTGGNNLAFWSFKMNNSNTNAGGWKNSIMRTKTCTEFFNALPKEWQDIIKTATKYTDNQGGGNDNNPITATSDKIFLLAEKEVRGSRKYANSHEQNYQLQYDYYKAGNTKVKYNHTSTSSAVEWWVRSPRCNNSGYFCSVYSDGSPSHNGASFSYGFAPAFVI